MAHAAENVCRLDEDFVPCRDYETETMALARHLSGLLHRQGTLPSNWGSECSLFFGIQYWRCEVTEYRAQRPKVVRDSRAVHPKNLVLLNVAGLA